MTGVITTIPKHKLVRLHGQAMRELNLAIHERDHYQCIICGAYVPLEEKFHHEPNGAGRKSDEITKGVCLCGKHHYIRHNKPEGIEIKEKCEKYLEAVNNG